MKNLILLAVIMFGMNVSAQTTERKALYKGSFTITQKIENSDTSTYFSYTYQNQKYQHISDLGIILTFDKASVKQFAEVLKEYSQKEDKIQLSYKLKDFSIELYDFSKNIYINDSKGKYTSVSKKQASKMADEILDNLNLLR